VRAILDPNVIISSLLSPRGAPAKVVRTWLEGRFELIVSRLLLDELERALSYPKLRERIRSDEAESLVRWLGREATVLEDPPDPPGSRSADPGDDYLLALAERERAVLVSGDRHVLALSEELPVLTPREFLTIVGGS
jgi:uncharacterized protein